MRTVSQLSSEQSAVCREQGVLPDLPSGFLKAGVALATLGKVPLNGLRHPSEAGTSGWFIWAGEELSQADDFFDPLHVHHLESRCPEVVRYLALPPGWRFLVAPGQFDVWYDEALLAG